MIRAPKQTEKAKPGREFSRREFIQVSAAVGGGMLVAVYGCAPGGKGSAAAAATFEPNAFLKIKGTGEIVVVAKHFEMGQGAYTGLATLIAEELDADWKDITVEAAPANATLYGNSAFGGMQGTGGSSAIANSYEQHRKAGAVARAMLLAAAVEKFGASDVSEITLENGILTHTPSGKRAEFGGLAIIAAKLPVPEDVPLKDPKNFRLIGKDKAAPRVDSKPKTTGKATYTQDVKLPGMLTAVVAHSPRFGGKVKSFDATQAKAVSGVVDVVQVPSGVAVLAENFWAAKQGRDALTVEWDNSAAASMGSAEISAKFRELAGQAGTEIKKDGDAEGAIKSAARTVEATFEVPFLAHACMEPMNCVVRMTPEGAEVLNADQMPTLDQQGVAQVLGLKPEQVAITTLYAGGSFGRRAAKSGDYVLEAASILKAIDGRVPVKLVWTREDDTQAGFFRPAFLHRMRAGLDGSGKLVGWWHRAIGPSVYGGTPFAPPDGTDPAGFEGAADHPYAVANMFVDQHSPDVGVPVQWWRSVGHSHTAFAVEVFVDELARAARKDPVEFRREHLANDPRRLAVLNLAAEKAGWGSPLPAGRARGVAVHQSFATYVAEVAEVSLENGKPRVHRVVCAVDCGVAVNPDVIRMQMESGIAYGLAAALYGAINIDGGKVVESNFDRYRVLRMNEMPQVEVHITPSTEAPTGVGEPGLPPIAPAVANALAALTGKPVRKLPLV
jgi:isoquinoline 1-oxidoreductase beta subunit